MAEMATRQYRHQRRRQRRTAARLGRVAGHLLLEPSRTAGEAQPQQLAPNHISPADDRPPGHRLGRLPVVTATPCLPNGELSAAQLEAYSRDGFLFVSGLIPPDVSAAAASAMWAQMAAENRNCERVGSGRENIREIDDRGRATSPAWMNRRDEPVSWTGDGDWPVKDNPDVMAVYTPEWVRAAEQLAAVHAATALYPVVGNPRVAKPSGGLAINRFPRHKVGPYPPDEGPYPETGSATRPGGYAPHSDYGWRPGDDARHPTAWRSLRQPVYVQHFVYLQSSGKAGGAGTLVWPGSHRALARAYVDSTAEGQRWMGPITDEDLSDGDGLAPHNHVIVRACEAASVTPVEVVSQPGDVLFHDLLTVSPACERTTALSAACAVCAHLALRAAACV
jgi:hypothetical protein